MGSVYDTLSPVLGTQVAISWGEMMGAMGGAVGMERERTRNIK